MRLLSLLTLTLTTNVFCQLDDPPQKFSIINRAVKEGEGGILMDILKLTKLDKFIESNIPTSVRDMYKMLITVPPVEVNYQRPKVEVTLKDVKDNYRNSLLPDCTSDQIKSSTCGCKETYPEIYGVESQALYSQGTVAVNQKLKKLVVSYRGTKNNQNNINNLSYGLIDSPSLPYGAQVAEGFYSYHLSIFHSLARLLEPMLTNPDYDDYTIQITGYSLGAAAAVASIPDWVRFLKDKNDQHKLEVYAYASPRSGNPEFAKFVNELGIPVIRYTMFKDFVPQFPPRAANFVHVGVEVHQSALNLTTDGGSSSLKVCGTDYDEDPKCSWSHHKDLDFGLHVKPFSLPIALPPFC